jgi:hypothetical protein
VVEKFPENDFLSFLPGKCQDIAVATGETERRRRDIYVVNVGKKIPKLRQERHLPNMPPDGAEILFGCGFTNMPRLQRWNCRQQICLKRLIQPKGYCYDSRKD